MDPMTPVRVVVAVVLWPFRQLGATLGNWWDLFVETEARDVIPPTVLSTLAWLRDRLPYAFGLTGSPAEQVRASVVLGVATILGIVTSLLALIFLVTGTVGLFRLIPVVDRGWRALVQ